MKYIIGIGTYAGGDDSIGLKIIEYMDKNYPRRDFKLIDMSDNGLNIFAYLNQDTSSILLVDCVKMGKQPGEHMFFTLDQVESSKELANISTHEGDMIKIFNLAKQLDYKIPPVKFLGIEPLEINTTMELSPLLASKIPQYVNLILEETS
ncbi:MAG: hydrogenase maturation protease [Deltaproteobacteria bacterium]|jgi:hydrogenase maturation protease|nr:hydrogenase maturation protease [Deltaproteobacteria bacterium]